MEDKWGIGYSNGLQSLQKMKENKKGAAWDSYTWNTHSLFFLFFKRQRHMLLVLNGQASPPSRHFCFRRVKILPQLI